MGEEEEVKTVGPRGVDVKLDQGGKEGTLPPI